MMRRTDASSTRSSSAKFKEFISARGLLSLAFLLSTVLLLFLSISLINKKRDLLSLKTEQLVAQQEYEQLYRKQKTGMLATSVLNELAGWKHRSSRPIEHLEYFFNLPDELAIDSLSINCPILYRPLPDDLSSPFFKYALTTPEDITVLLVDSGKGKGKYVFPSFFERLNSKYSSAFKLFIPPENDIDSSRSFDSWQLTASFKKQLLWSPLN